MTNPHHRRATVYIDGNLLKTTFTNEKFLSVIQRLCTHEMYNWVEEALTGYGDWFLLDRLENTLQYLTPQAVFEKLDIKTIHEDILQELDITRNEDDSTKIAVEYEGLLRKHSSPDDRKTTGRVIIHPGAGRINYSIPKKKR